MSKTQPFSISAIHNEKIALMLHLQLDTEDNNIRSKVHELEGFKLGAGSAKSSHSVSVFEYDNDRYHVAHMAAEMESDVVREFNSNWWKIKKVPAMDPNLTAPSQASATTTKLRPGARVIESRHAKPGMWIERDNPRFNTRIVGVGTTRDGQIKLSTDYGHGGEPASEWYEPTDKLRVLSA